MIDYRAVMELPLRRRIPLSTSAAISALSLILKETGESSAAIDDEIRNRGGIAGQRGEGLGQTGETLEGAAARVCERARFSVKSLCGLKHDRPESVPSYVSIKHRPRGRPCGCVRVHLAGRGSASVCPLGRTWTGFLEGIRR